MSIIPKEKIALLHETYSKFCKSVTFREGENFYIDSPEIFELSYNENPLGAGELARNAMKYHSNYGHRYPPLGYTVLIDELSKRLNLTPENFIISAGSVSAVYLAVFQYTNPGDKVIYSKSSMPWYRWSVIGSNAIPIEIPLMNDMNHDLEGILASIDKDTKVIILSNPHNPTGLYINESEVKDFYDKLPENVLLILDQAYYEYQSNQENIFINLINDSPNLMLTRTFSKIHGLAGLRIGYGISNPNIIEALKAKWLGSMPTITSVSTYAAYEALHDDEHIKRSVDFNKGMKKDISSLAKKYGLSYLNSEANFVLLNIFDSVENVKFFQQNNMALTAGYFFGYPEWARISFDHRKSELLEKLENTFSKIVNQ